MSSSEENLNAWLTEGDENHLFSKRGKKKIHPSFGIENYSSVENCLLILGQSIATAVTPASFPCNPFRKLSWATQAILALQPGWGFPGWDCCQLSPQLSPAIMLIFIAWLQQHWLQRTIQLYGKWKHLNGSIMATFQPRCDISIISQQDTLSSVRPKNKPVYLP